jgi:hypothetical protein
MGLYRPVDWKIEEIEQAQSHSDASDRRSSLRGPAGILQQVRHSLKDPRLRGVDALD